MNIDLLLQAVVEGGAAWQDGRLEAGDQLLAVDGHSLVGITQVIPTNSLRITPAIKESGKHDRKICQLAKFWKIYQVMYIRRRGGRTT